MADDVNDEAPAPSVSTEQPDFSAVLNSITRHMDMQPVAPTAAPAVRIPVPEPKPAIDNRALARIGLPEDLRRAALTHPAPVDGADPSLWLVSLLQNLPQPAPMPRGQGAVIVVAGARDAALELARSIVDELGLDDESFLIASPGYSGRARPIPGHRRLHDAEAAAEARRSWRRRSRPTVVAVEAPAGIVPTWELVARGEPALFQRRRFARVPVLLPARAVGRRGAWGLTILDVSEGGIRCLASQRAPFDPGESIEVSFDIDGALLTTQAEVVRWGLAPGGVTIVFRFTDLSRAEADRLRRFVFRQELVTGGSR